MFKIFKKPKTTLDSHLLNLVTKGEVGDRVVLDDTYTILDTRPPFTILLEDGTLKEKDSIIIKNLSNHNNPKQLAVIKKKIILEYNSKPTRQY